MATNINSIMSTLLKSDTVKGIAKANDIDASDVSSILSSALPALLGGASKQSTSAKTAESFASALESHASKDVSNIASFISNIDVKDGAKIVGHLLGKSNDSTANKIAKSTGIDAKTVAKVMAMAAPILMSLIGNKTQADKKKAKDSTTASIASAILGNVDVGSLLTNILKK